MTAASPAHRLGTGLRLPLRMLVCSVALLAVSGFAAAAGGPVDQVPDPRLRPASAPSMAAADPAQAETAAVMKRPMDKGNALANINQYFNSFRTMQGKFIQFGPHGEQSEGRFFLSRPGKIRFSYDPPAKLDVISDGRNVAIRDGRTATQDYYPLSKTPLRYLIANHIDLTSNIVSQVREEPDLIALVIVENSRLVKGKLTLIFDRHTYQLKQWIVTDAQGLNTSVAIYNTTTGKPLDPSLFKINYYLYQ